MNKSYLSLDKLEVYRLSVELSDIVWVVYEQLDWRDKKTMGDQFVNSTDSVGANIAEGYGRFHYLDKAKFYYNSRGSLLESRHWFNMLVKRQKVTKNKQKEYLICYAKLRPKLNSFINSVFKAKSEKS